MSYLYKCCNQMAWNGPRSIGIMLEPARNIRNISVALFLKPSLISSYRSDISVQKLQNRIPSRCTMGKGQGYPASSRQQGEPARVISGKTSRTQLRGDQLQASRACQLTKGQKLRKWGNCPDLSSPCFSSPLFSQHHFPSTLPLCRSTETTGEVQFG